MANLRQLEQAYLDSLQSQYSALEVILESMQTESLNLQSNEITLCLVERLNAYYSLQYKIKELLRKRYIKAGADYFVESVLFYIKLVIENLDDEIEVYSERQVKPQRGEIRPDISIWKRDELLAIIECKTQLGWNRHNWEADFRHRKKILAESCPNAKAFLLVMTDTNWKGFEQPGHEDLIGKEYFCLLKEAWPGVTNFEELKTHISGESRLELLILELIRLI